MAATSLTRIVMFCLTLVAGGSAAVFYGIQHVRREPPVEPTPVATLAAPVRAPPTTSAPNRTSAAIAPAQAEVGATAAALASTSSETPDDVPSFDVARVEPTGEAVIAGRAAPGATVQLLRNGETLDQAVADQSGQFVMVPPRLPPGNYELTLRASQPGRSLVTSKQSVAVAIEAGSQDRPVVALMTPDKPTLVLSQPVALDPMDSKVTVQTVETEPGGRLYVSGHAPAGAAVRLYLNDRFLAAGTAAADGGVTFTIDGGVKPGNYRVRLDHVASNSGEVRSRAEVPFDVPEKALVTSSIDEPAAAAKPQQTSASKPADASAAAALDVGSPSTVVVPKIVTTIVSRGDSLWHLSRVTYGVGTRYAVIYNANRKQIRNPDLIYPGQIFVLPGKAR